MKKSILIAALLAASINAHALNVDGTYVRVGDHISVILKKWGSEQYRVTSDKTCHAFKKNECSFRRLIWKRSKTYHMVQVKGSTIIKIKSTQNKQDIRKVF